MTGGQIRKTMSISNNEPLGALAVLFQHEHYLDCPVHEYLMTCEYYWHHVSLKFIQVSLYQQILFIFLYLT